MFNKDILDKYVKLSNGRAGKVIRIRSQLRGKIAEVEINPPNEGYKYQLVAVDREQALTDERFKNLPHIVEVIGENMSTIQADFQSVAACCGNDIR